MESSKNENIKAYLDNSILSELRLKSKEQIERITFILKNFKKRGIVAKNFILTDKLFLEIIGHGNCRKNIVNEESNKAFLIKEKDKFVIQCTSQENIKNYYDILKDFFNCEIKKSLPQNSIYAVTLESFKKNCFIDPLHCFEQKIIQYSMYITNNSEGYDAFISTLAEDSIIRYLLLDTANKSDENSLREILNFLLIKYDKTLHENLLLFMAGIRMHLKASKKYKDQSNLIRIKDDFADSEAPYLAFYGKKINEKLCPITVITYEKIETIKKRLDFYFVAILEIAKNKPRKNYPSLLGNTIVFTDDFKECKEMPSGDYLSKITKSSYTIFPFSDSSN